MDVTLMLEDKISRYLYFREDDHQVKIINLPDGHPLTAYKDDNDCLDLKKYSERYFILIHTILTEMEKRWPLELEDVELDNFTTKYIPCVKCMNTDMTWTQVFRCRHTTECQHLEEDDCQQFTTPSVSISKIGNKNIAKSLLSFV